MTTYLVKFLDQKNEILYMEVMAETASEAVRQVYSLNEKNFISIILDIYVKV